MEKKRHRDWFWVVVVLVFIVMILILFGKSGGVFDYISILLAMVALILSLLESKKSNIKLEDIINDLKNSGLLMKKLDENTSKNSEMLEELYKKNNLNFNSEESQIILLQPKKNKDKEIQVQSDLNEKVCRGDIYFASLGKVVGSEQGGSRPVVVIQNDIGNKYSPTVTVAPLTQQINQAKLPTHVVVQSSKYEEFEQNSVILLEQMKTIAKQRLGEKITRLDDDDMNKINESIQIQLGLFDF